MSLKSQLDPIFMLFLAVVCWLTGCSELAPIHPDPKPGDTSVVSIPPTTLRGSGGSAFLAGAIRDLLHPSNVVQNSHLCLLNSLDYSDTIASGAVVSENATFVILDLPEITSDLVIEAEGFFLAKIGKLRVNSVMNALRGSNRVGLAPDSTIFMTSVSDSVGRPGMPSRGVRGYIAELVVHFKSESSDSLSWEIVVQSNCDTISVYRYDDPVFDPEENDVYVLRCESLSALPGRIAFFDRMMEVKTASPIYLTVQ